MKRLFGSLFMAMLLALAQGCGTSAAAASRTMPLGHSSQIPAAQGEVRLSATRNGNTEIQLRVEHLAPPGRIVPGTDVFVVWARGQAAGANAENLGALIVDRNLRAKIKTTTAMTSFDLFITCEQSQTTKVPALLELLPLHFTAL